MQKADKRFPFVAHSWSLPGVTNESVQECWVIHKHLSWRPSLGSLGQAGKNLEKQVSLVLENKL